METEIYKEINDAKSKFIVGTAKQDIIGAVTFVIAILLFTNLPFSWKVNLGISLAMIVLGTTVIIVDFDQIILRWYQYFHSTHNVTYYDADMDNFVDISNIKNDTVYLKDGRMVAVLKVEPIDFSILDDKTQEVIINSYMHYLNSIDHDIQVTSRSVRINYDSWLNNIEARIKKQKNTEVSRNLERFYHRKKWLLDKTERNNVRNRVFYIQVSPMAAYNLTPGQMIRQLWRKIMKNEAKKQATTELSETLKDISDNINNTALMIGAKLEVRRLTDNELFMLYANYYTDTDIADTHYLTPFMAIDDSI